MAAAHRCPACGFESDSFPNLPCPHCGTVVRFEPRRGTSAPGQTSAHSPSSQATSVILLNLTIAVLSLAFLVCLLFGLVTLINSHNAFNRVQGQPYHATTLQVIRPFYQKSAGMHGPDVSILASGIVEGKQEWMNLAPYLKSVPRERFPENQAELNDLVPPGTEIPVYLFPNLKGQSRIQVIDVLPPGEASRKTEMWVLKRVPVAIAVLGALIFFLMRIRRSYASPATQAVTASYKR